MKLPNGYGSVTKLSGNRRRPYRARITSGWKDIEYDSEGNPDYSHAKQQYVTIGYFATRAEALNALADFNRCPYDLDAVNITFAELYEKWSSEHFPTVSDSSVRSYQAAFLTCKPLYKMRFKDIRLYHLQGLIDDCGKNYPTLKGIKILFNQLFRYAMQNDICGKDYSLYVNIAKYHDRNPNSIQREMFSLEEIETLWKLNETEDTDLFTVALMMIYTGVRLGELRELKKDCVHLQERYFDIVHAKTKAGIRKVPIAEKVYPFFEHWMTKNDCEFLISNAHGRGYSDRTFRDTCWTPIMNQAEMQHRPHDTRHTCISLLTVAGVDDKIIKKIVGHAGTGVTEIVYTHFELQLLIDAINQI